MSRTLTAHGIKTVVLDVPWFRGVFEMGGRKRACAQSHAWALRGRGPRILERLVGLARPSQAPTSASSSVHLASLVEQPWARARHRTIPHNLRSLGRTLSATAGKVIVYEGSRWTKRAKREFRLRTTVRQDSSTGAIVHPQRQGRVDTPRRSRHVVWTSGGPSTDSSRVSSRLRGGRRGPRARGCPEDDAEVLVLESCRTLTTACSGTLGYTSARQRRALEESGYRVLDLADGAECASYRGGVFVGGGAGAAGGMLRHVLTSLGGEVGEPCFSPREHHHALLNQGRFLEETLLSVQRQDYPRIEHIVVDGGSSDGTLDIIRRHERTLTRWTSEPDRGQTDAIAKGFAMARGMSSRG